MAKIRMLKDVPVGVISISGGVISAETTLSPNEFLEGAEKEIESRCTDGLIGVKTTITVFIPPEYVEEIP